jgi:prepilin signal peptidase PulO-like enzyme (type II secretory pathway)
VTADERGSGFALLSVCDNAIPLLNGVLYTQVYNTFLNTFPGAIFVLTLVTQMLVFSLITFIHMKNPFKPPLKDTTNSLIIEDKK